ncbi:MAG TPA: Mov34/MPN/PAD-1 family protein [Blastocatellia bacterium]|jgi:proteasome lid subunit RPN8/RPN11
MQKMFEPIKSNSSSILMRERPASNKNLVCFASQYDGFETYIHLDVLHSIAEQSKSEAPNETIGLLAGRVWRDVTGNYTVILAAEGAKRSEIDTTPSHVRISGAGNAEVRRRLEAAHPALDIVGWYHTHPVYTPRFSSVDETEQKTWTDPNSIGIVFSGLPLEEPFGVYRGPVAELLIHKSRQFESHKPAPVIQPAPPIDTPPADKPVGSRRKKPKQSESTELQQPDKLHAAFLKGSGGYILLALALSVIGALAGVVWVKAQVSDIESRLDRLLQATDELKVATNGLRPPKQPDDGARQAKGATTDDGSLNARDSHGKAQEPPKSKARSPNRKHQARLGSKEKDADPGGAEESKAKRELRTKGVAKPTKPDTKALPSPDSPATPRLVIPKPANPQM